MEVFKNAILGYEVVDWLIRLLNVSRREANLVAMDLHTGKDCFSLFFVLMDKPNRKVGLIIPVARGMPFVDGFSFYRWSDQ
jgi:hypothetical protein